MINKYEQATDEEILEALIDGYIYGNETEFIADFVGATRQGMFKAAVKYLNKQFEDDQVMGVSDE